MTPGTKIERYQTCLSGTMKDCAVNDGGRVGWFSTQRMKPVFKILEDGTVVCQYNSDGGPADVLQYEISRGGSCQNGNLSRCIHAAKRTAADDEESRRNLAKQISIDLNRAGGQVDDPVPLSSTTNDNTLNYDWDSFSG